MKQQIVYVSRLMTARQIREACAMTKLIPNRLLIGGMFRTNKKAVECGNTQTA